MAVDESCSNLIIKIFISIKHRSIVPHSRKFLVSSIIKNKPFMSILKINGPNNEPCG